VFFDCSKHYEIPYRLISVASNRVGSGRVGDRDGKEPEPQGLTIIIILWLESAKKKQRNTKEKKEQRMDSIKRN
jgi:hypothetical protein